MPRKMNKNGKAHTSLEEITDDAGYYCVKSDLLWKYRAVSSEYENVQLRLTNCKIQLQAEMAKHPEIKALRDEQSALLAASQQAMKELEEVQQQISARLGIDLKNCGIDDKTGRIHVVNTETGKSEPLLSTKKKVTRRSRVGAATT